MNDNADDKRRSTTAEKALVGEFLTRLMGLFGHSSLPREMQAALDNAGAPSTAGGLDSLARPLAACVDPSPPVTLVPALEHIWSFRTLAPALFGGKEGRKLAARVRKLVREELRLRSRTDISASIADRQLQLLHTWLTTGQPTGAEAAAAALHAETQSLIRQSTDPHALPRTASPIV